MGTPRPGPQPCTPQRFSGVRFSSNMCHPRRKDQSLQLPPCLPSQIASNHADASATRSADLPQVRNGAHEGRLPQQRTRMRTHILLSTLEAEQGTTCRPLHSDEAEAPQKTCLRSLTTSPADVLSHKHPLCANSPKSPPKITRRPHRFLRRRNEATARLTQPLSSNLDPSPFFELPRQAPHLLWQTDRG